jgi:hypothetical protein
MLIATLAFLASTFQPVGDAPAAAPARPEGAPKAGESVRLVGDAAVKPVVTTHAVAMKRESVDACIDQIGQVWDGIRKGVFPTRPGWPCKTCPYASRCPAAINPAGASDEP